MNIVPHAEEEGATNQGKLNYKWEQGWGPVLKQQKIEF